MVEQALDVALLSHAGRPSVICGASVRVECGPHGAMGVMESGTGGAGRDAEGLGDLGRAHSPRKWWSTRIARCSGGSLRNPRSRRSRSATLSSSSGAAGPSTGRTRRFDDPATLPRRLGDAHVDDETLEPGIEPVRIAEPPQVTPGDHQRVLKGILGPIDVAQDPLGDREEPVIPNADQVDERLPIPVPCRLDEIAVHGSLLPGDAQRGRLPNLLVDAGVSSFILRFGILARKPKPGHAMGGQRVYQWFVFIHLVGFAIFIFAHGASAFATFQIRGMRDADAVAGYLALSQWATRTAYLGLTLLLIGGAGAASVSNLWAQPWVWGSVVVLILVLVGMYAVGATYYYRLRDLLAGKDGKPPLDGDALAAYLDSRVPDVLGLIGASGVVIIVYLMVLKPG